MIYFLVAWLTFAGFGLAIFHGSTTQQRLSRQSIE